MILGASAAAMGYVGAKVMFEQPAGPEPAYHPAHEHHDFVGGLIYAGLAGAALGGIAHQAFRHIHHVL